jgi:hypothetical protein
MCFFSPPKIPAAPITAAAAQRQAIRLPDNGASNYSAADDIARRRRAMAANSFTGALGLGSPTTTPTVLGG